jgi:hypothetical protein
MSLFDVPDRIQCTARRSDTNTPLQALATLNDEQFLECAQQLAAITLREFATEDERLTSLFRRATGRRPEPADLKTLREGLSELRSRYHAARADAEALLRPDSNPLHATLDRADLASWMLVASVVLNLDETLVRD